jgi:hypothetical protein
LVEGREVLQPPRPVLTGEKPSGVNRPKHGKIGFASLITAIIAWSCLIFAVILAVAFKGIIDEPLRTKIMGFLLLGSLALGIEALVAGIIARKTTEGRYGLIASSLISVLMLGLLVTVLSSSK